MEGAAPPGGGALPPTQERQRRIVLEETGPRRFWHVARGRISVYFFENGREKRRKAGTYHPKCGRARV